MESSPQPACDHDVDAVVGEIHGEFTPGTQYPSSALSSGHDVLVRALPKPGDT